MTKKYKCRVEYLESTGTQYIDTGVNAKSTLKTDIHFEVVDKTQGGHIFGGRTVTSGGRGYGVYLPTSGGIGFDYETRLSSNVSTTNGYRYRVVKDGASNTLYVNGVQSYTGNNTAATFDLNVNIALFYMKDINTSFNASVKCKVFYFKIWDNNTLVRDMIPVLDNSGRPAMYDQVSGQLFYNQGSGDDFSYGRQIIPVEYLESTGTQYIDTGFKGKNNLHYKAKVNFTTLSTGSSNGIGGEYLANASAYIGMVRANGHYTYLFNNTAVETTTTIYANTDYEIDSVMDSGNQVLKVNGETISTGTLSGTFTSTRNIFLYAICSTNEAADVYGSLKMYYCQIYDNGVLVRDFIPCIDENLTPFMFDKVNGTVYLNAGTGQFKVGPNVEKTWGGKKLRKKLALALANLKKKRKYYCEVEYLESTGTQYIDTGYIPNTNTECSMNLAFVSLDSTYRTPFSVRTADGATNSFTIMSSRATNDNNSFAFGSNYWSGPSVPSVVLNKVVTAILRKGYASWDGVIGNPGNSITPTTLTAYMFARNANGTAGNFFIGKIYKCTIKDGDTFVRDFIPVLDWNMTPCMYDRVTEQLFYNQGTGDFVAGREIHPVEYLESTGTQYINTGLLSTASSTVDTEFSFTSMESGVANNVGVFGGRNTTTANTFTFFKIASATPQYFRFDYNGQPQVATASDMTWNTASKYRFQYNGTNCITTNTTTGESTVLTRSPGSTFTQYPIHLFAVNTAGTMGQYLSGRIYYYKYSDGTKSVDMVPAIDSSGTPFMFDRVSHSCFLNAGTGVFKYPAREVEYIETDGTSFINTGYTPSGSTETEITTMLKDQTYSRFMFGCRSAQNSNTYACLAHNQNRIGYRVGTTGSYLYTSGYDELNVKHTYKIADGVFYRDDVVIDTTCQGATTSPNSPLALLTINTNNVLDNTQSFVGNLYSCTIKNNNTLIRDFIPVFKDGQAGMLDKANNVFYSNAGTGSFSVGRILEPEYE